METPEDRRNSDADGEDYLSTALCKEIHLLISYVCGCESPSFKTNAGKKNSFLSNVKMK